LVPQRRSDPKGTVGKWEAAISLRLCEKKAVGSPDEVGVVGGGGAGVGGGLAGAVVTLTDAVSDLVGSALLMAVTVSVPALAGAVYIPAELILPNTAFQVTDLFEAEPTTVAVNGSVPVVIEDATPGLTVTEVTPVEVEAAGLALTWAELALSPVAVTAETT
jgi:hypothetical protein